MSRPGIGQIKITPGAEAAKNSVQCGNTECTVTQLRLQRSIHIAEINPRTGRWNNSNRGVTRAMLYDWLLVCDWAPSKGRLLCPKCAG